MPEESVVRKTDGSSCCIVFKRSPYGALVWPAQERVAKGVKVLMPDMQAGSKASWLPVFTGEGWEALPTKPLPPHVIKPCFENSLGVLGVVGVLSGAAMSSWEASARGGFACVASGMACP